MFSYFQGVTAVKKETKQQGPLPRGVLPPYPFCATANAMTQLVLTHASRFAVQGARLFRHPWALPTYV